MLFSILLAADSASQFTLCIRNIVDYHASTGQAGCAVTNISSSVPTQAHPQSREVPPPPAPPLHASIITDPADANTLHPFITRSLSRQQPPPSPANVPTRTPVARVQPSPMRTSPVTPMASGHHSDSSDDLSVVGASGIAARHARHTLTKPATPIRPAVAMHSTIPTTVKPTAASRPPVPFAPSRAISGDASATAPVAQPTRPQAPSAFNSRRSPKLALYLNAFHTSTPTQENLHVDIPDSPPSGTILYQSIVSTLCVIPNASAQRLGLPRACHCS